jgi:hypothetical protein
MFRTVTRAWMAATEAGVDPLMNRSWTNRTEHAISGNKGSPLPFYMCA